MTDQTREAEEAKLRELSIILLAAELQMRVKDLLAERDTALARIAELEADLERANLRCDLLADSNYLAGVGAGWNAAQDDDPNAALAKLQAGRTGHVGAYRAALDDLARNLQATPSAALARAVNEVIERAEQACRYAAKHQNWEDDGEGNRYREGFEVACEVCEEAIRPHVERHLAAALSPAPTMKGEGE